MSPSEKSDRKAKLNAWREGERSKARGLYPLADERLENFFVELESLRAAHGCCHDLRHAQRVIEAMALSASEAEALLDWCNENGGYCDCEIAANTLMHWHQTRAHGS